MGPIAPTAPQRSAVCSHESGNAWPVVIVVTTVSIAVGVFKATRKLD